MFQQAEAEFIGYYIGHVWSVNGRLHEKEWWQEAVNSVEFRCCVVLSVIGALVTPYAAHEVI